MSEHCSCLNVIITLIWILIQIMLVQVCFIYDPGIHYLIYGGHIGSKILLSIFYHIIYWKWKLIIQNSQNIYEKFFKLGIQPIQYTFPNVNNWKFLQILRQIDYSWCILYTYTMFINFNNSSGKIPATSNIFHQNICYIITYYTTLLFILCLLVKLIKCVHIRFINESKNNLMKQNVKYIESRAPGRMSSNLVKYRFTPTPSNSYCRLLFIKIRNPVSNFRENGCVRIEDEMELKVHQWVIAVWSLDRQYN